MRNNLKNSVRKLIWLLSYLSTSLYLICLTFSIVLYANKSIYYFDVYERNIFIIVSFFPCFIYVAIFYLYENIFPYWQTSINLLFKSLFYFFVLSVPSIIITYRFNNLSNTILTILAVVPVINFLLSFFYSETEKLNKYLFILNDIKFILFDYWRNEIINVRLNHFVKDIQSQRADAYFTLKNLETFQSTLSCPYIDAVEVSNIIKKSPTKTDYSILDIGGYDGLFTYNLLSNMCINDSQIEELIVIEPLSTSDEYLSRLGQKIKSSKIKFIQNTFEEWIANYSKQFNLILASHSLYSIFDNKRSTLDKIINKFNSLIKKPDGDLIIILANKASRAYTYKRAILSSIYGQSMQDTNAVDFTSDLDFYVNTYRLQKNVITINNFINVSDLLKPTNNSKTLLKNWLSYFVRIPEVNDLHYLDYFQNLLDIFSLSLYELPQELLEYYRGTVPFKLDMESKILMHKTNIIHIKY